MIRLVFMTGSVDLPRPTGRWRRDPDGGCWEEHTPHRTRDRDGRVVSERPYEPAVRIFYGDAA